MPSLYGATINDGAYTAQRTVLRATETLRDPELINPPRVDETTDSTSLSSMSIAKEEEGVSERQWNTCLQIGVKWGTYGTVFGLLRYDQSHSLVVQ